MDPDSYAKDLCTLADSYSAGELTPGEWRRQMAALRDKKLERQGTDPLTVNHASG